MVLLWTFQNLTLDGDGDFQADGDDLIECHCWHWFVSLKLNWLVVLCHQQSRHASELDSYSEMSIQELGLLLVLVAVAILTYSSLVYFAGYHHHIIGVRTCLVNSNSLNTWNWSKPNRECSTHKCHQHFIYKSSSQLSNLLQLDNIFARKGPRQNWVDLQHHKVKFTVFTSLKIS